MEAAEEEAEGEVVDFRVTVREVREAAGFPGVARGVREAARGRLHRGGSRRREESRQEGNRRRPAMEVVYSEVRGLHGMEVRPRGMAVHTEVRRPRRPRGMAAHTQVRRPADGLCLEDG